MVMEKEIKDKTSIIKVIMITAGIVSVLAGSIAFFVDYGVQKQQQIDYRKNQIDVSFDDHESKIDTRNHMKSVPNDVTIYEQSKKFTSAIKRSDSIFVLQDSVFKFQKKFTELQNENTKEAIKSRALRDEKGIKDSKILVKILDRLEVIDLRQKDFKKEINKLKDSF